MAYTKTTWQNDQAPAINATNLNKIETGIFDNDSKIAELLNTLGIDTNTWVSTDTYNEGDIVIYNDKLYKNITGNYTTTDPATDTTNWMEVKLIDGDKISLELLTNIKNDYGTSQTNGYSQKYINDNCGEVVWVNNRGNPFSSTSASVSFEDYTKFKVYYFTDNHYTDLKSAIVNIGGTLNISENNGNLTRQIDISSSTLYIHSGYYQGYNNDDAIIPSHIIGYK